MEENLLRNRAALGDGRAVGLLFDRHRPRLEKIARLRLDPRVKGKVDGADIVQDVAITVVRRAADYFANPQAGFFVWIRGLTNERVLQVNRHYLGIRQRDAKREVALHGNPASNTSSVSLAAALAGNITTPSKAVARKELQRGLQTALDQLEPLDREVLWLRHFEELANNEVAEVLQLSPQAAANRYTRALEKLANVIGSASQI